MAKVVVIGGGWAGCAAALSAKKAGAEVVLVEKTDCSFELAGFSFGFLPLDCCSLGGCSFGP